MSINNYSWRPYDLSEIIQTLSDNNNWILCGGHSVDLWLKKETRKHSDIDIGVFRSDLKVILDELKDHEVYLCDPPGSHRKYDGIVPERVFDIWIAKSGWWVFQIVVFDDIGDMVVFKRNRDIKWHKKIHYVTVGGVRILNPAISLLYKITDKQPEKKTVMDICNIINGLYCGLSAQQGDAPEPATNVDSALPSSQPPAR